MYNVTGLNIVIYQGHNISVKLQHSKNEKTNAVHFFFLIFFIWVQKLKFCQLL